MTEPVLEMRNITKKFPGVIANDHVNLQLFPGEVHALLGENGAGKSTLMNILTGIYMPDEGELFFRGKSVELKSPKTAVDLGIGMVHQHFKLIEPLTVAENIYLACGACKYYLNLTEMNEDVRKRSESYNLPVDPAAKIWQLSVGEQQRVEIVKLLFRGADILIFDEPTAVLTPQESDALFATLHDMAKNGKSILFITHKMAEVMEHADRITVLRGGKSLAPMMRGDVTTNELTRLMVGRELEFVSNEDLSIPLCEASSKDCVLQLQNITAIGDRGIPVLKDFSLSMKPGKILGIAGVAGNGQRELCEVINGLRKVKDGQIICKGKNITNLSPKEIIKEGISYIPEDRIGVGLAPTMNMEENAILRDYDSPEVSIHGFLKRREITERTERFVREYEIKNAGINKPISLMSGGNLQKLLIAREVNGNPDVIIAAYPVHGLDIGATNAIHEILLHERERGAAILLISEDLDQLFRLSDEIAVMFEGSVTGQVVKKDFTYEGIGKLMVGDTATLHQIDIKQGAE